jgi:hypothetical protein
MRAKAERRIRLAKILPQDVSRYSQGNRLSGVPSSSQKNSRERMKNGPQHRVEDADAALELIPRANRISIRATSGLWIAASSTASLMV